MTTPDMDAERKAFESNFDPTGSGYLATWAHAPGHYIHSVTHEAWKSWQARDNLAAEQIAAKDADIAKLREAAECLIHAYREKYLTSATGRIRINAPLLSEVGALKAALTPQQDGTREDGR